MLHPSRAVKWVVTRHCALPPNFDFSDTTCQVKEHPERKQWWLYSVQERGWKLFTCCFASLVVLTHYVGRQLEITVQYSPRTYFTKKGRVVIDYPWVSKIKWPQSKQKFTVFWTNHWRDRPIGTTSNLNVWSAEGVALVSRSQESIGYQRVVAISEGHEEKIKIRGVTGSCGKS